MRRRLPEGLRAVERLGILTLLRRGIRRVPAPVALASVLLFLVSVAWAVVTPAFRGADEAAHLNSVVRLAEGGGWPEPGTARFQDELRDAEVLAGGWRDARRTIFPRATPPQPGYTSFTDLPITPPAERASLHDLDEGPVVRGPDQMTQHPPGYYAVAAAVYRLADAGDWRYDRALLLIRVLTALTVAAVLPVCCFAAARDLTGSERAGVVAAFVPLLVPQLHFISGTVTNDGLTIAAAAVVWALLLRVLCAGPTRRRLLFLALAVGASCWTKGTVLTLLPAVVVAVVIGYRRLRGGRPWLGSALAAVAGVLGLAGALGGWWWVLNVVRYGSVQPSGAQLPVREGAIPLGLGEYLWLFVQRLRWTFFLEVGGRRPSDLSLLTAALAVGFAVLCVVGIVALRRRADRVVLLLGAASMSGLLVHTTYTAHLRTGLQPGIQGRYLYVLLVPIAVLIAVGLARIVAAIRPESDRWLPGLSAVSGVGVAGVAALLNLRISYGDLDDGWADAAHRFLAWAAVPRSGVALLAATLIGCSLVVVVVAARHGRQRASGAAGQAGLAATTDVPVLEPA